jgi:hypothetical protein
MEEIIKELQQLKEKVEKEHNEKRSAIIARCRIGCGAECLNSNVPYDFDKCERHQSQIIVLNNRFALILGNLADAQIHAECLRNHF